MSILIWKDGEQLGPFTEDQLHERLKTGTLSPNDLAWKEGYSEWKPLSEILLLDSRRPVPPSPPQMGAAEAADRVTRPAKAKGNTIFETAAAALKAKLEDPGSKTYWWARRRMWIIGGVVAVACACMAFGIFTEMWHQWAIDRQKQRIKAEFDAYREGAAAFLDSMKQRQAAADTATAEQQREAQQRQDYVIRQRNEQQAEASRKARQAAEQEQLRQKEEVAQKLKEASESQQRVWTAAEEKQRAKRAALVKINFAPPASSGDDETSKGSAESPEVTLTAVPLGKWPREQDKRIISSDGKRTVLVVPNGSRVQAWVDGQPGPVCREVLWKPERTDAPQWAQPSLPISPDSKRVAYLAAMDEGGVCVISDATRSPVYKEIKWIGFGPGEHHLAYIVNIPDLDRRSTEQRDRLFVVDNGNAGLLFSRIDQLTFSADGQHLAYIGYVWPPRSDSFNTNRQPQCCVVLDGAEQKHFAYIQQLFLSRDGSHCGYLTCQNSGFATEAVIDGKQSRSYKYVRALYISDNGSRNVLVIKNVDVAREYVVDNGHAGPGFLGVGEVALSSNGDRLAYVAQKRAGLRTDAVVIDNGESGAAYDSCGQLQMDPEGNTLCYLASASRRSVIVVNGKEYGPFSSICEKVAFSPDGKHWACGVQDEQHFFVLFDGEQKPSVAMNPRDTLSFAADNKQIFLLTDRSGSKVEVDCFTGSPRESAVFQSQGKSMARVRAGSNGHAHVTVNGIDGPDFRSISDLIMSSDGRHVAYVAADDVNSSHVVVDGANSPAFESVVSTKPEGPGRQVHFNLDGSLSFLAVSDGKLSRYTYSAEALNSMPSMAYLSDLTPSVHDFCAFDDSQRLQSAIAADANGNFYGIAGTGGQYRNGCVFSCSENGTESKVLHSFYRGDKDGEYPFSLISTPDGELYGTTVSGGFFHYSVKTKAYSYTNLSENIGKLVTALEDGSLFAYSGNALYLLKPDGSGLKSASSLSSIRAAAIGPDGAIYCVTNDSVTRQSTIDSPPVVLHHFVRSPEDGYDPGPLIVFGQRGELYGYSTRGGTNDRGTIFEIGGDQNSYKILIHVEPDVSICGLVPGDQGTLYGLYKIGDSRESGFFALAFESNNPTKIGAYKAILAQNPMIYRNSAIFGCGWNSFFRLQIPRHDQAQPATPTVKIAAVAAPPLAAVPIVFTSPHGESNYYDLPAPGDRRDVPGSTDNYAQAPGDQTPGAGQDQFHDRQSHSWQRTRSDVDGQDQEPSIGQDQEPFILRLDQVLNNHDWSELSNYIGNGTIDYFGHRNVPISFVRNDMEQDARNYQWTRTYPNRASFRQYTKEGLVYESIQEQTEAQEINGRHHQANCLLQVSYQNGNPPKLVSVSLKVLR